MSPPLSCLPAHLTSHLSPLLYYPRDAMSLHSTLLSILVPDPVPVFVPIPSLPSQVEYSTVQCSTVQYSTVQYNTVQYPILSSVLHRRTGALQASPFVYRDDDACGNDSAWSSILLLSSSDRYQSSPPTPLPSPLPFPSHSRLPYSIKVSCYHSSLHCCPRFRPRSRPRLRFAFVLSSPSRSLLLSPLSSPSCVRSLVFTLFPVCSFSPPRCGYPLDTMRVHKDRVLRMELLGARKRHSL